MYIVYNGKTHLWPFFLTFCLKKNVISNHSVITVENRYLYTKFVIKNPENVLVILKNLLFLPKHGQSCLVFLFFIESSCPHTEDIVQHELNIIKKKNKLIFF